MILGRAAARIEYPPGQATFPYHYELGNDELLVVVSGTPTLRTPQGERELRSGDCIHFPSGEAGAHQVTNRAEAEARVLLISNLSMPRGAVQVDSRKMMIRWGAGSDERAWFPIDAATDYWEGEQQPKV
jgi:uncharacterized cupin superfamily protein